MKKPSGCRLGKNTVSVLFAALFLLLGNRGNTSDLVTVAEKIQPAVVRLIMMDASGNQICTGSGFFSEDGRLITNFHVIKEGSKAIAEADNGATYIIDGILASDPKNDIAILKVRGKRLPKLSLGTSLNLNAGTRIVVVGSPLGLEGSVSDGIISSNREMSPNQRVIQLTAPISPGSNGSPVCNNQGNVIGIATLTLTAGQSLYFAIPVENITSLLSSITDETQLTSLANTRSEENLHHNTNFDSSTPKAEKQTPAPLPKEIFSDIQLELINIKDGIAVFSIHNGTKYEIHSVIVNLRRWSQHGAGRHSDRTRKYILIPKAKEAVAPFAESVLTVKVGDFLDDSVSDYGRGPVTDPTMYQLEIIGVNEL